MCVIQRDQHPLVSLSTKQDGWPILPFSNFIGFTVYITELQYMVAIILKVFRQVCGNSCIWNCGEKALVLTVIQLVSCSLLRRWILPLAGSTEAKLWTKNTSARWNPVLLKNLSHGSRLTWYLLGLKRIVVYCSSLCLYQSPIKLIFSPCIPINRKSRAYRHGSYKWHRKVAVSGKVVGVLVKCWLVAVDVLDADIYINTANLKSAWTVKPPTAVLTEISCVVVPFDRPSFQQLVERQSQRLVPKADLIQQSLLCSRRMLQCIMNRLQLGSGLTDRSYQNNRWLRSPQSDSEYWLTSAQK